MVKISKKVAKKNKHDKVQRICSIFFFFHQKFIIFRKQKLFCNIKCNKNTCISKKNKVNCLINRDKQLVCKIFSQKSLRKKKFLFQKSHQNTYFCRCKDFFLIVHFRQKKDGKSLLNYFGNSFSCITY